MGFFDFLNSKYKTYKTIYTHIEKLCIIDSRYKSAIDTLIPFYEGSTLTPFMFDRNMLNNPEKLRVMIAYFGGASDYISQAIELNDTDAIPFMSFYIALILFDGNYKKLGEIGQTLLNLPNEDKYYNIMIQGGTDIKDLLKEKEDASTIFMRLNKLL